jgi:hypothetical protein
VAAITYWVDPDAGSDIADGKSYANRIKTIDQLTDNMQADGNGNDFTINCLNTADYVATATRGNVQCNGLTTSTFVFRGVSDSSATPALATVKPGGNGTRYFIYFSGSLTCAFEYFDCDCTADESGTGSLYFVSYGPNTNGVDVRYCKFRGGDVALGTKSNVTVYPVGYVSSSGITDFWDVHHCVFENSTSLNVWATSTITRDTRVFDNVFIFNVSGTSAAVLWNSAGGAAGWNFSFYGNTCYVNFTDDTTLAGLIRNTEFSDALDMDFYNNVFYYDTDRNGVSSGIITGASGSTGSFVPITAIGYNMFYKSDNIAAFGIDPYDEDGPWDPDIPGTPLSATPMLYTGDVYEYSAVEAETFSAPTATYDWTPDGSSIALEIPKDLRLLRDADSGLAGSVPGALPPAATTYTVGVTVGRGYFHDGETVSFVVTISNAGVNSEDIILLTNPMPADLNYIVGNESQGTFTYNDVTKTGSWVVGTLASGASATLEVGYIAPIGVEDDQILTATFDSGSLGATGESVLTDTATAAPLTSSPGGGIGDGGDPNENPAMRPFLDTLPLQGDIHEMDINLRLATSRNREREQYVRSDVEGKRWAEARVMRVNVATNTAVSINLGGIEQGHYLLVESDSPVLVSVNGTAVGDYIPQAKVVVLIDTKLEQLAVKNASTTAEANVLIAVVD